MKRIPISKVLELTNKNKFEITCAAFDAVDHVFKLDVPKSLHGRKSAVQALTLLADDQLKYGYDEYAIENAELKKKDDESTQESSPPPEDVEVESQESPKGDGDGNDKVT